MQSLRAKKREIINELLNRNRARKALIPFTRFTFQRYKAGWHHELIASWLERLTYNTLPEGITGVMVFAPPRHGKSELGAIRWPAWNLGHNPADHFIATAYGDSLATTFSKGCRNTVMSPLYQRLWRHRLKERTDTKWQLAREDDDNRATYMAAGILSALTGEGATKLIVDDPVKNAEEAYSKKIRNKVWDNYQTAANTRMAPGGKKLLQITRWHEDDLPGCLLKLAAKDKQADQWIVLVLAATNDEGKDAYIWNTLTGEKTYLKPYEALWPEGYSREELNKKKSNLGPVFWDALYMQRPSAMQGGVFKAENWSYYDTLPQVDFLAQVYDTAHAQGQENDFSASITIGSGPSGFPIFDAWRDKLTFPYLVAKVYERWAEAYQRYSRFPDRIVVENKGSGISLIQQLETNNLTGMWTFPDGTPRRVPKIPVTPMPATVSKYIRAQGISGYHESKMLWLPRNAPWVLDFVAEHSAFDKGEHDDYVDCTVHGVTFYVRPVEAHELVLEHYDPILISSDLDDIDGRGW